MEEWEPEIEEQRSVQELCAMLWQYVEPVAEPPTGINMVNREHVRTGGGETGCLYGTMGRHVVAGNGEGGRETNKGSGGWVSLSDL